MRRSSIALQITGEHTGDINVRSWHEADYFDCRCLSQLLTQNRRYRAERPTAFKRQEPRQKRRLLNFCYRSAQRCSTRPRRLSRRTTQFYTSILAARSSIQRPSRSWNGPRGSAKSASRRGASIWTSPLRLDSDGRTMRAAPQVLRPEAPRLATDRNLRGGAAHDQFPHSRNPPSRHRLPRNPMEGLMTHATKQFTRRSVTTGLAAAVTAIPGVGLAVAARSDPVERIKHHTREIERALAEHYPGAEIVNLSSDIPGVCEKCVGFNPNIVIIAQLSGRGLGEPC